MATVNLSRRTWNKVVAAGAVGSLLGSPRAKAAEKMSRGAPAETLKTDVCVIGGGSGGVGAALSAAPA